MPSFVNTFMKLSDILQEEITVKGDTLQIATQSFRSASGPDAISTYFRVQPYVSNIKGCDAKIYSLMNYVSSDLSTEILRSIKGHGPYKVVDVQMKGLLKSIRLASKPLIQRLKPDIIIYPKSGSGLLKSFVDEIASNAPSAEVLSDSFAKVILDAEDVEPLINVNHPDWAKFAEKNPKDVILLKKSLKANIKDGELQLKNVYKPYAKFIANFIELRDAYNVLEKVLGKKVLVIDDVLSSGTTMTEMVRQLSELEPESIDGLTMFKRTSNSASKSE